MIAPDPNSDLSMSLIVVTSDLIDILAKSDEYMFVDTAKEKFVDMDKRRTEELFNLSLMLLYAIGTVKLQGYMIRLVHHDNTR